MLDERLGLGLAERPRGSAQLLGAARPRRRWRWDALLDLG